MSNKVMGYVFMVLCVANTLIVVTTGDVFIMLMNSILGVLCFVIGISFLDNSRDDW